MSDGGQKEGQQSAEDMAGFNEKNLRPLGARPRNTVGECLGI